MDMDTKEIKKTMRKFIALTILLVSTICSAQVQYCGSDSSQRTLVNNLLYSEQFEVGGLWSSNGTAETGNTIIAPDGTLTADTITATATTNTHFTWTTGTVFAATAATQYRYQIKVKAGTVSQVAFGEGGDAVSRGALFNLSTNAITGSLNLDSSSISDLSDGWKLLTITYTRTNTSNARLIFGFTDGTNSFVNGVNWLAAGTETFYAWGAQLHTVSAPTDYIKTIDTFVTAGLANTTAKVTLSNLALRSEEFDNAAWTKAAATITANAIAAPDGTTTADRIVEAATTNNHGFYTAAPFYTLTGGYTYRWSVYAKKGEREWVILRPYYGAAGYDTYFNLTNCTVGANASGSTSTAVSVGNDWCRLTVTRAVASTVADGYHIVYITTGDNVFSYAGDITKGAYVWGAQLNLASLPSDYLATTTAAATLAGVCPAGTTQSLNDPSRCFAVTDNRIRKW